MKTIFEEYEDSLLPKGNDEQVVRFNETFEKPQEEDDGAL